MNGNLSLHWKKNFSFFLWKIQHSFEKIVRYFGWGFWGDGLYIESGNNLYVQICTILSTVSPYSQPGLTNISAMQETNNKPYITMENSVYPAPHLARGEIAWIGNHAGISAEHCKPKIPTRITSCSTALHQPAHAAARGSHPTGSESGRSGLPAENSLGAPTNIQSSTSTEAPVKHFAFFKWATQSRSTCKLQLLHSAPV